MSHPFPQYAKSDHFEVLAIHRENERQRRLFLEAARDLCRELTGRPDLLYFNGFRGAELFITGLNHHETREMNLPGQWKKPDGNVVKPFKKNPIHKEFQTLKFTAEALPGRRVIEWGAGYMGPGSTFEHDGFIYSHFGFTVTDDAPEGYTDAGWEEIKASEWHTAKEAFEESTP